MELKIQQCATFFNPEGLTKVRILRRDLPGACPMVEDEGGVSRVVTTERSVCGGSLVNLFLTWHIPSVAAETIVGEEPPTPPNTGLNFESDLWVKS